MGYPNLNPGFRGEAGIQGLHRAVMTGGVDVDDGGVGRAAAGMGAPLEFDHGHFLFLVPFGLFATAIPVSPGGIGTGQAAFVALFAFLPGGGGSLGADACTVFQFVVMCVYLTGLWAYISRRRDAASAEVQEGMSG